MIDLYPYQRDAVQDVADAINVNGKNAPLVVAPTGAGKTIVGGEFVRRAVCNAGGRVLWIAHRRELIRQASDRLPLFGLACGEIMPGGRDNLAAPVQVASIQTLVARGVDDLPNFSHIILDEAHHYASDEWKFVRSRWPDAIVIGLTATPCRGDGRGLGSMFDSVHAVSTIRELTALGFLVPCEVTTTDPPLNGRAIACSPVDAYLAHAKGERAVVFAQFVEDAKRFVGEFEARGIRAVAVHGKLSRDERAEALRRHDEDGAVLVNVGVLTEGWDSPETSTCILARGCSAVGLYLQIVGRVLRKAPGKRKARLIDLTGRSVSSHGEPVDAYDQMMTSYGLLRPRGSDKEPSAAVCIACSKELENGEYPCAHCGFESSSHFDALRVKDQALVPYAAKRSESADKRIDTLARWYAEARARGHKEFSVVVKFEHVYGRRPNPAMIAVAKEHSRSVDIVACADCGKLVAKVYKGGACGKCRFQPKKEKAPSALKTRSVGDEE